MHEDKRIIKTKNHLKSTLIKMLEDQSFDKITVKDLCEKSQTSRITFYTHFDDKYELAETIFKDMIDEIISDFNAKQPKTTPQSPSEAYCRLLDCILDFYCKNIGFFSHITLNENQYLYFLFRKYITNYVGIFAEKLSSSAKLGYSPKKISGFLCFGLWGFINMGLEDGFSFTALKRETREILEKIIDSDIITNK